MMRLRWAMGSKLKPTSRGLLVCAELTILSSQIPDPSGTDGPGGEYVQLERRRADEAQ